MAKKKKSHKKHQQFKHATSSSAPAVAPATASSQSVSAPKTASLVAGAVAKPVGGSVLGYEVANLPLIKRDIRKVLVMAASFVALQLVLWFLFEHTGLGSAVYNLVRV